MVILKVSKMAKIRKRYNQVPHLTRDTTWESNKNTINITNKRQEVSPFPAGDHKAAINRRKSIGNTRHKNTNDPQEKYRLGTVSKTFYWRAYFLQRDATKQDQIPELENIKMLTFTMVSTTGKIQVKIKGEINSS